MAAKALAEYVRAERLRRGETPFELGECVLDPRHFEFRHGQSRGSLALVDAPATHQRPLDD
jgi:hypothetical protein